MKKFLFILLCCAPLYLLAQPVAEFQQFNGRLDFTAIGNTLNEFANGGSGYCDMLPSSSANLALTAGQTFVSAHMYWGSVGSGDFDVALNGTPVSAQRVFSHSFNGLPYFAAYADVTDIVAATGNGNYTFSDLDVSAILNQYCGTNFGGWGIYIIYSDPSLQLNQISLFDGLESVSSNNNSLDITLTSIDVSSDIFSKIGFLAWEGEESIANGESLYINGILIDNPPLNPANNAFNGTNSYTNSNVNYNMDLDYYDLVGIVQPGDVTVDIQLTSLQDFIMVNNIITSVNSELPDATIVIDDLGVLCANNNIDVEYTVYNVNSTNDLPANTPVAFYADAVLIGQTTTVNEIPMGGSESGVITLGIPIATPNLFDLRAVVDDIGNGTGIVSETDETNNEFIYPVDLSMAGILLDPGPACLGSAVLLDSGVTDPPFSIQWYRNTVAIPGATNPTLAVVTDGIYYVEALDGICSVTSNPVVITFRPQPIANPAVDLFQCDDGTTAGVFDLTVNDANILGAQNPALFNIKYYETLLDSQNDTNEIVGGIHIINPPSPQTIYARIEELTGSCYALTDFEIYFSRAIAGIVPVVANYCDDNNDGGEFVDLFTEFNSAILDGEPSSSYNITYHNSQADADADINPLPNPYFVTAPGEIVYIRLENRDDATCFDTTRNVNILIDTPPTINNSPPNLILCDDNNDGFATFDLSLQTDVITLGDPNLTVSYHGTLLDAENNLLPLPLLYINDQIYLDAPITNPVDPNYGTGGVWARVSSTVGSCMSIVPFGLEVRFTPVAVTPAEPLRQCDDAVADGFTFFDLTVVEPEVLGTMPASEFDIYYYEDLNEAILAGDLALTAPDFSQAIPDPTAFLNSVNPQDIYILVVGNATSTVPPNPNTGVGCYDIVTLTLIVDPLPEDFGPFEMMLCDDELQGSTPDDEISTFDLTTQDILVTNNNPTITVEWFLNAADEAANIPIPNPTTFQNTATPQTVIGRATSEFGCSTLVTLTLTVLPNPNPNTTPTPLELCDDDDDGIVGGWDLTLADADIINGEADVSVLYYEDLATAIAGLPTTEITMPYTNTVPFNQTVYARVVKNVPPAVLGCFTIVELELIVIALPDMPDASFQDPFIGCDESGNGQAIFNLTLQDAGVLGTQDPANFVMPITYYEDPLDAEAGTNPIATPGAFLSGGQTIWVRLESLITGCVRITQFEIEVEMFPTIGMGDDLTLCDDDLNGSTLDDGISTFDLTVNTPLIDLGDTTLSVFYYATAGDQAADNPIVNPEAYQNIIVPQQQIFVTVYSANGCRSIDDFFIVVEPNPVAFSPGSLIACDGNNDGFAEFDLSTATDVVTAMDPNLTVSYHGTYLNALNDLLPLPNLYINDQIYLDEPITDPIDPAFGTGGVWARVVTTVNSCVSVVSFALEVHSSPVAIEPEPLRQCDDEIADGFTLFDLTVVEDEVLGTVDAVGYDIYYYEDLNEAVLAGDLALTAPDFSQAIPIPTAYTNITNPQDVYILVVGNANSSIPPNPNSGEGCYDIVTLTLIVDPIPLDLGPFEMMLCDDELQGSTPDDEISTFDLTTQDILVTGGDPDLTVLWFETPADEAADNPIPDPTIFQNISTPQTVVGRVTSLAGCSNKVFLTLTVLPNPSPITDPTPLELCDDDDDGIVGGFDLTLRDVEIINGELDVSVLYYETFIEAEAGTPGTEIVGPYTNITPFSQIVFARVTKDVPPSVLACYTIVELELIVVPLPDRPDTTFEDPLMSCDESGNGQAVFDLTLQNAAVYGVQDPIDFAPITYYTSLADAEAGINFIDPATAFVSGGQTIWVRLESLLTGCFRISQFEIVVGAYPPIGIGEDLYLCDDEVNGSTPTDGLSTFDLTVNTVLITMGDPSRSVIYYASAADLASDTPISNPVAYQNIISPQQEIFAAVYSGEGCRAINSFFINVDRNPIAVQPSPLIACDINNDGFFFFDLESKSAEIIGTDPSATVTYHESLLDANTGDFALTSPYENIIAFNQTVYARMTHTLPPNDTGCYSIVSLELIVNPTPEMPQIIPDLELCDDNDDGIMVFDLTDQDDIIYGTQSPALFELTYHISEADATAGINPIADPANFTNTANPQPIWARLLDINTGCFKIGSFNLVVTDGLAITDPTPLEVCDTLGEPSDGFTTFDLTQKNSEITNGVLTQGVSYYLTQQDALDDINRISPDTAYENVTNPQTVYVRVEDSNSECISYTTLTLRVLNNPNPITPPEPITLCDVTDIVGPNDEVEIFDLTIYNTIILNGSNWDLDYYTSYDDAVNAVNAIPTPEITAYQNISNPQRIYVRTTNPATGCFEIVELELIVNPLPDDTAVISSYLVCEIGTNGIGVFDLTTKYEEILNGQPQPPFEVSFYLDPLDAENQVNALVNVTSHQNMDAGNNPVNPQTIYTGILNAETGCYIGGVQSFELIVQESAFAVQPAEPFVICDNLMPSDGFAEFDLDDVTNQQVSDLRAEILGGQDPAIYGITFYETIENAEAGIDAITFPYVNTINPQRIYVRVTNTENLYEPMCYAVVDLVLKVESLPEIILDDEYRLCVDENGNPIAEEEGSMSPPLIDTGLDPALYTFQWDLDGVIIPGETGPSIIALQGGVYTVVATELLTGCETIGTATVTVSSPPLTFEATLLNGAFAGNHVVEVTVTGDGSYVYQLDDGPFQESNIFENVEPGDHTITVKDKYGCGSVTFDFGVIDYPQYFTPNGDGYHDTWNIIGIATGDPGAKIYIFDRFGKLLKQISPIGDGWDGTYSGNQMPSSDYWFRVEYREDDQDKEFKGHFTLKR